jgi:hypothetical protein
MRIQKMLAACSALTVAAGLILAVAPATAQDRGDHGGDRGGDRGGDHGDRGGHNNNGNAVAAGALGFVLGAAIADSQQHRDYAQQHMHDRRWMNSCRSRYRSFDPGSGTYLGNDGRRYYCRR